MASELRLKELLRLMVSMDASGVYDERNRLTYLAIGEAAKLGLPVGFRLDPQEPEWPVVFIELPTGQVSWHVPQHPREWDGHTTRQKNERIDAYRAEVASTSA